MSEMTQADFIWNRACGADPLRALPGDRALSDMLYAHGLVMNGGVIHAVESMSDEEYLDSKAGYSYYRLEEIGILFSRARETLRTTIDLSAVEHSFDREYLSSIPSDGALTLSFEKIFEESPMDFAPLRPEDVPRGMKV